MTTRRMMLSAAMAATLGATARAQTGGYPNRLVRIVVPFSAGSSTDILARALAPRLATAWGQQVIVDNRPGIVGAQVVAKSPPDGYVLILTANGHAVLGSLNSNLSFDPIRDFAGVSQVATMPVILVVPPDSPIRSVAELIAAAKAQPDLLGYGSAGVGSSTGLAAAAFAQAAGIRMTHVPYRGLPEMHTSVMRSDSTLAFTFFNGGGDLIQAGKLRALAVSGGARMAILPEVPTFAEAGLPGFTYDAWFGVMAPAGTPAAVLDAIAGSIAEALRAEDMVARFAPQGVMLSASTPAAFDALLRNDADRYGALMRASQG